MLASRRALLVSAAPLLFLGAAILTGCPPGLEHPERFQTGCPSTITVEPMLRDKCSRQGCHSPGEAAAAGLDLASAGVFERMYGRRSGACDTFLVSPDGPAQSLLVQKIDGTTTCGARMPLGDPKLSDTEVTCVEQWITERIPGATLPSEDSGPPPDTTGGSGGSGGAPGTGGAGGAGGSGG
ncbi:MAG: hypothetical protein U0359_42525 [Byssovorax sp.]